jgi:8-oxo-dGTP pyrophosphatase MutT (NUDIX family)
VWDLSAGGSVLAGETSGQGASRELFEEVGIEHDFTGQRPDVVISIRQGFFDVYVIEWDGDLLSLNLQNEEVADVRWVTQSQLITMIDEGSFYPYPTSLIDLIFTIHDQPESVRGI